MLRDTGRLLVIFCAGSVGTVLGTVLAMKVLPLHLMGLGADGWKVGYYDLARVLLPT